MVDKRFKEKFTFEERSQEARKKREEHPTLVPVIIEKHTRSKLQDIDKNKFLASHDMKFQEFQGSIKKKLNLSKTDALFFFIAGKKLDKPDTLIRDIYEKNKDDDGFLYITFAELEA
eukprot:CAMPEP_0176436904 /NCGR_PEP_ID=MMETSP0127-20121128/18272_1 /TAXON_ID=938130 /ORGANISM="Platyophrya macrostoma, Strain WH" /LENGTH=116 /DNA_ID=CAMNT_0017820365 /DNA_START=44 /DNA_END=390 /DNA_ORIENTATION=-